MIPSEIGFLTILSESSAVALAPSPDDCCRVFDCTLMLVVISHSAAWLDLDTNSLMGTIPSEIQFLTSLSESNIVWLLAVKICCRHVFHWTLMLARHFSFDTAQLDLSSNSLTGPIPSEIKFLTRLSESSIVWFSCRVDCGHVFHWTLMLVVIFHSTGYLYLYDNSLTGTIPSEIGTLTKLSESSIVWLLVVTIVVVFFIVLSCASSFFILQLSCLSQEIV
jgi:hypothetical protein